MQLLYFSDDVCTLRNGMHVGMCCMVCVSSGASAKKNEQENTEAPNSNPPPLGQIPMKLTGIPSNRNPFPGH
jgi:hypothetical protein